MTKRAKRPAPIAGDQSVSETIATILMHNLVYLQEWEQAARTWEDIEGVHQTRVSFRRMRSALTTFRSAIPGEVSKAWSDEMRWLANQLGPARDLDVFIDEALGGTRGKLPLQGEDKLAERAAEQRASAYGHACAMWDGERFARFRREFSGWIEQRGWEQADLGPKSRKRLAGSLRPFSRKILDKQERKVLEAGTNVDIYSAEEMHRLRIECKKLRYAAEFFTPIFAGMETFIQTLKGLQDILGVMNDVVVMKDLLGALLAGVDDPEVLQYSGGVIGWRTRHYFELLQAFDSRWEDFVSAKHPWWRKSHQH